MHIQWVSMLLKKANSLLRKLPKLCKKNIFYFITSDVPDSLSGSGSGRILPFLSDIRIRPDLNLKKKSGSGRILIKKKSPGPAGS